MTTNEEAAVPLAIDKDAIIAGLQENVSSLRREIDRLQLACTELREQADENYANGDAWRGRVRDAESERDKARKAAEAATSEATAERRFRAFAEGYIAAMKGQDYRGPAIAKTGEW